MSVINRLRGSLRARRIEKDIASIEKEDEIVRRTLTILLDKGRDT